MDRQPSVVAIEVFRLCGDYAWIRTHNLLFNLIYKNNLQNAVKKFRLSRRSEAFEFLQCKCLHR